MDPEVEVSTYLEFSKNTYHDDFDAKFNMESKKKRGSNYTNTEKQILVELTNEFKDVIENKELNTSMLVKKRDIWNEIARRYNTAASSGPRTWQQLRHWYDNHKQMARKGKCKHNMDNGMGCVQKFEPYTQYPIYPIPTFVEVKTEEDQASSQESTSNELSDRCSTAQNRGESRVQSLKVQYYRTKLKNARLETRLMMRRNRMETIKHRKEMEILRVRLRTLQGRKR